MTDDQFDPTGLLPLLDGEESFGDARPAADPSVETLRRLEREALGLFALTLDPETPRAGARERLLAALGAKPEEPELAPVVSLAAVRAERGTPMAPEARSRGRRWGLAAAMVAAAVGFGAAGWSYTERLRVEGELARVQREHESVLGALRASEQQLAAERAARAGDVGRRDLALQLVSSRGVEVCPLRPVGVASSLQPEAFAVLYMAPAQKAWYVKASQLTPPPPGRTYRVWFETPSGPVLAGDLRPAPDFDLQFEAAGFRSLAMTGVTVTLEPAGAGPERTGPEVLFGADKMVVL